MYTFNRIHNDYDTNVVRVELNSSLPYRPHTHSSTVISRATSREPLKITSSTVNRSDTFTKPERPTRRSSTSNGHTGIIRSETFVVKYHNADDDDDYGREEERQGYEDFEYEKADYGTYTRSKKKSSISNGTGEKDDNPNYATYTRKEKEKRRGKLKN